MTTTTSTNEPTREERIQYLKTIGNARKTILVDYVNAGNWAKVAETAVELSGITGVLSVALSLPEEPRETPSSE